MKQKYIFFMLIVACQFALGQAVPPPAPPPPPPGLPISNGIVFLFIAAVLYGYKKLK